MKSSNRESHSRYFSKLSLKIYGMDNAGMIKEAHVANPINEETGPFCGKRRMFTL